MERTDAPVVEGDVGIYVGIEDQDIRNDLDAGLFGFLDRIGQNLGVERHDHDRRPSAQSSSRSGKSGAVRWHPPTAH